MTLERPLVSVLTPAYNHATVIGHAIESVLAQTFTAWEMLVVDDGSNDATVDVVRSYDDPRIVCIEQPHVGIWKLSETYARAVARARGELLAMLDGDDWWPENKLALQVPLFAAAAVAMTYGSVAVVDERDGLVVNARPPREALGTLDGAALARMMLHTKFSPHSVTVMLRRDVLTGCGGFVQPDYLPLADYPTWMTIAPGRKVAGIDAVLGYYRVHPQSVCRTLTPEVERGQFRFFADYLASTPPASLGMTAAEAAELRKAIIADGDHVRGVRAAEAGDFRAAREAFRAAIRNGGTKRRVKSLGRLAQALIRSWC